ncbi:tetratricopeptide repeat protein [Methylophilaceae bacterium]|nr:tetratricopeptide repeat protein [Methylophilaceae bacterium]
MDKSNEIFESAVDYHKKNDLINAEKKYREYLKTNPKNSQCLFALGTLLIQKMQYKDAIVELKKSTKEDSKNYHCFQNLGIAYFEDKQFDNAIDAYKESLALNNKNSDAYNNLGNSLYKTEKYDEAIQSYTLAIKLWPNKQFLFNRAKAYRGCNQYKNALSDLWEIDKSSPLFREAEDMMASLYDILGKHDMSIPIHESRIKNYENNSPTYKKKVKKENLYIKLISAFGKIDDVDNAKKTLATLTKEFPKSLETKRAIAHDAYSDGRYKDAINCFKEVLKIKPNSPSALQNLAISYQNVGNYPLYELYLKKALDIDKTHTQANISMGIMLLKEKRFREAWPHYEYRLLVGQFRSHKLAYIFYNSKLPKWDGRNDNSSILFYGEQGIGDQICLAKLITKLKDYRNQFTFAVEKRLLPLFKRSFPESNFHFVAHDINIEAFFDFQAAIFRLGFLFINEEKDISSPDKYLLAKSISSKKRVKKRIGISWYSQNKSTGYTKSLELTDLIKAIGNDDNFEYINLQYGEHEKEIFAAEEENNIQINRYNDLDKFNDIDGLFSLVDSCDIIITISNVTAHIAGSLGKKSYLLLAKGRGHFWYWMKRENTNDSLWYPSVQIIQSDDVSSLNPCLKVLQTKLKDISSDNY